MRQSEKPKSATTSTKRRRNRPDRLADLMKRVHATKSNWNELRTRSLSASQATHLRRTRTHAHNDHKRLSRHAIFHRSQSKSIGSSFEAEMRSVAHRCGSNAARNRHKIFFVRSSSSSASSVVRAHSCTLVVRLSSSSSLFLLLLPLLLLSLLVFYLVSTARRCHVFVSLDRLPFSFRFMFALVAHRCRRKPLHFVRLVCPTMTTR